MRTLEDAPPELTAIPEPTGKRSETRVKDARSARALVRRLVQEDEIRSKRRTTVKGLIDGNAPYPSEALRNAGLAWQTNLNLMEGKALMDSSAVPYYSMFAGAETYVEVCFGYGPENPDAIRWGGFAARRFHNMLKRWPGFEWQMQQASFWQRMHGIGPVIYERDGDWRFRSLESGALLVPRNSPSSFDRRIPYAVARFKYRTHELFGFIRDEDEAKAQGWNIEAVRAAIKQSWRQPGSQTQAQQWEQMQRSLKNDDLFTSYNECDEIHVAHIYVNEYSGKVTHLIVTESPLVTEGYGIDETMEKAFLYQHVAKYDGMEQLGIVFFQDIGDGTWHSVRGLADLAFKHLEVLNRLDCRMIDGAFIDGGIVLQPEGQRDIDKIQSIQWGPFTVLPAGLKMQQGRMSGQLEGTMAVSRTVRNGLSNNIGMFNQRSVAREDGRGEAVTAEQIRAQVAKESTLSQGQMALQYLTLDRLYAEMFRRASDPNTDDEEALRFQRECEEDGIPREAFDRVEYVRANRAAGFGSPQMAFMQLSQLMPIVPSLPTDGQRAYSDLMIQATVGAEKVRLLNPEHHVPSDDDTVAAMEALMFDTGRQPPIASGQDDVLHVQAHLADAANKLMPLRDAIEGGDKPDPSAMQQASVYITAMSRHTEEHLLRMRTNPMQRQFVKQFENQLKQVVDFDGKLRGELIKAQRAAQVAAEEQQNAAALDATTAATIRKTEADIANDRARTIAKIQNDRIKTVNTSRLKQVQTAEQIRNERVKTATNGSKESE